MSRRTVTALAALGLIACLVAVAISTCADRRGTAPAGGVDEPSAASPERPDRDRVRAEAASQPSPATEQPTPPERQPDTAFGVSGDLRVTVRRADGSAAAGAQVAVYRWSMGRRRDLHATLTADTDGRATLRDPEGYHVEIAATLGDAITVPRKVTLELEDDTEVNLTLEPAATLTGVVLNADDEPVPEATVRLYPTDDRGKSQPTVVRETGPAGRFAFPPRPLSLTAKAMFEVELPGGPGGIHVVRPVPAGTTDSRIRLPRTVRLRVRVIDIGGLPIEDVGLMASGPSGGTRYLGMTDAEGRVDSEAAPAAYTSVQLFKPGHAAHLVPVEPVDGIADLGDIRLAPAVTIRGHVTGPPSPEAETLKVRLYFAGTRVAISEELLLQVDGRFEFGEVLDQARYDVYVELGLPDDTLWMAQRYGPAEVRGGATDARIDVPAFTDLHLRFSSAQTGEPLPIEAPWVWVQRGDGSFVLKGQIRSKSPGTEARIAVFEAGIFDVIVEAEGYERVRLSRVPFERGTAPLRDVALQPR